ncbi:MAG: sulfite exporter TauE/SafE family protein [Armatimonadota bacterium]
MHLLGIDNPIVFFMLVGFCAQLIDGAIGMAYGVISTSLLLFLGVSPLHASASVKAAEMVTTGVSGFSHHLFGNIDRKLVLQLLVPGVIGGIAGAYILTRIDGNILKPYISAYLVVMGLVIIAKAFRPSRERTAQPGAVIPLGLGGGFFDAIGGGGWGPIVTTNMVAMGHCPRTTIGTVNAAEFFVTIAQVTTFVISIGVVMWQVSLGLLLGGVLAAPLAAYLCKRLPRKTIMVLVGVLICIVSAINIYKALT